MKKILFGFVILLVFFVNMFTCKAVCDDGVLLAAKDVKVEAIPMTEDLIYYIVKISNLTPNLYVTVYQDDTETMSTYTFDDSNNGVIEIEHWYIYEKVNFRVNVYSSVDGCLDESLNELNVTTNKYNDRYEFVICKENPDVDKCQPFYEEPKGEEQTDQEFYEEMLKYNEEKNITFVEKVWTIVKAYYLYVLIPIASVAVVYGIAIYVYKAKEGDKK